MKNLKFRIVLYIAVFIVAAVLTYIFKIDKPEQIKDQSAMSSAGLPVVHMTTESGLAYNYLHGYTSDVDITMIRDAITPVTSDRELRIFIKKFGCSVSGISYEIRSLDGQNLIERNNVSDYSGNNGVITADMKFRNLLDANEEYMLKIIVSTEEYDEASYYTRIVVMENPNTDRKLQYVNNFSSYTLDDEEINNITAKLEPNSTGDNTNLGRVNIHSKQSQVGFGALKPYLKTGRNITLNEISANTASVTVTYTAYTDDETGSFEYQVKEFYRINQPDEKVTYVYSFDRFMDQKFDAGSAISSNGDVYLGICSDTDIEMKSGASGKVVCFVRNNELWRYNISKNELTEIFSFDEEGADGIREKYDEHAIKILDVDSEGNVKFLVYGYMNRGIHEGQMGISLFSYDASHYTTSEIIFIPRTDNCTSIAKDIDTLAYINSNNILYLYSNRSIYYLDCTTKEYMVIANHVLPSACMTSEESSVLMYQCGDDVTESRVLNLLHLDTGEVYEVYAAENERIKALGFIDGNIVYGKALSKMISVNEDGNVNYPMYTLVLMDKEHNVVKEYGTKGIYVTDVVFYPSKLEIYRAVRDAQGNLTAASTDSLLSNKEEDSKDIKLSERVTDHRQKEQYISLTAGTGKRAGEKNIKYTFESDSVVHISNMEGGKETLYYVYGYGCLYDITSSLAKAVESASNTGGVVVKDCMVIWSRYKDKEYTMDIAPELVKTSPNSGIAAVNLVLALAGSNEDCTKYFEQNLNMTECFEKLGYDVYNLTGAGIELAEYFINNKHPVIAKTGPETYEVVYGYSASNVSSVDFITGTVKSYTIKDFDGIISQYGSVLITVGE